LGTIQPSLGLFGDYPTLFGDYPTLFGDYPTLFGDYPTLLKRGVGLKTVSRHKGYSWKNKSSCFGESRSLSKVA